MYIHICINVYIDTHEHTLLSVVTGVSKQQDVYAYECVWDSSCELKRDNASMIKYSRGRNIHIHCLYLLRETRTRIAPCMIVLYVCIERNSYFPFFLSSVLSLSPSLFVAVYMATTKDEEKKKYYILSIIWLVDFFFASSFSPHFIVTCLLFFLILPSRFVDKRPRKGRGHPIEEKKQVISSCKRGCFFFVRHQRVTHNTLFFHHCYVSLCLSLYLFLFVNLHLSIHAHTHTQSKTTLYSIYC